MDTATSAPGSSVAAELLASPELREGFAALVGTAAPALQAAAAWLGAHRNEIEAFLQGCNLVQDVDVALGLEPAPDAPRLLAASRAAPFVESWGLPGRPPARLAAWEKGRALIVAGLPAKKAQPVRIGRRWANGSRNPIVPEDELSLDEFFVWLAQRTRFEIDADRDEDLYGRERETPPDRDALSWVEQGAGFKTLEDPAPLAVELIERREEARAAGEKLDALRRRLTASELEVLDGMAAELSLVEIARRRGSAASTVGVLAMRIRTKARVGRVNALPWGSPLL